MKNKYILFAIISLFSLTISCKKDEAVIPVLQSRDLAGTWELRFLKGPNPSQSGSVDVNVGNELKFTETGYEKYANGRIMAKGSYQLIPEKNIYTGNEIGYRLAYKFDEVINGFDPAVKEYVMIVDGRLVVYTSNDEEYYVRIR